MEEKIIAECKKCEGKPLALSGGIDSTLLAVHCKPKFAISVELPGGEKYNEIKWAKKVAEKLELEHIIVKPDEKDFDDYTEIAVKAIGRPIPHFNIFPLFCMYKELAKRGETELILGDGPDETMCGYARDLIFHYLYKLYEVEAFENYHELLDKILPPKEKAIELFTRLKGFTDVTEADIAMRKDMDDMSDGIARHFGIKNIRPYQDNPELDDYMKNLPIEEKIQGQYGKWSLRRILAQYFPEIADRVKKVGGPVYPVNLLKGWDSWENYEGFKGGGEFDKTKWIDYQRKILNED